MPLWKEWTEEGARFAIWQVGETAGELRQVFDGLRVSEK